MRLRGACLALLLLGALLPGAAGAEVRSVEAVGAVPIDPNEPPRTPLRDAALRKALLDAVWRVAAEELPDFATAGDDGRIGDALGDDPLEYATRFRILEDRGERPALFSQDPEVEREYVVVVAVQVDVDRVRQRLAAAGLRGRPSGEGQRHQVRVVLEEVDSYASYRAVQTLLEELGVRSAVPVELERGRAVLAVDGHRRPDQLLSALMRAAPPELDLTPLGTDRETVRLRARFVGTPAALDPGAGEGARPFDTPKPNRY